MPTRDQKYAEDVYKRVSQIKIKGQQVATSYGSMAHKLPILIHTSGLIQALTFVETRHASEETSDKAAQNRKSKSERGPELLLEDLSKTVLESNDARKEDLLERARGNEGNRVGSLQDYIYLTRQVLAALLWYKRYAQSILGVEYDMEDENSQQGGRSNGGKE